METSNTFKFKPLKKLHTLDLSQLELEASKYLVAIN